MLYEIASNEYGKIYLDLQEITSFIKKHLPNLLEINFEIEKTVFLRINESKQIFQIFLINHDQTNDWLEEIKLLEQNLDIFLKTYLGISVEAISICVRN